MMPNMNGMDLFAAIRAARPGLERRIVFVTGGAFVPRLAAFLDSTDNPRVLKPFNETQLRAAIAAAAER
jgi:CheY-like chemotaxis protein